MTDFSQIHKPVLLQECVDLVTPALHALDSVAVDCTLGLAGHTIAFLKAATNATVIGIDRDEEALEKATARITGRGCPHDSFRCTPLSTSLTRCCVHRV